MSTVYRIQCWTFAHARSLELHPSLIRVVPLFRTSTVREARLTLARHVRELRGARPRPWPALRAALRTEFPHCCGGH